MKEGITKQIAKSLYNFGYQPEKVKYYRIYEGVIEKINNLLKINRKFEDIYDKGYSEYVGEKKCFEVEWSYDIIKKLLDFYKDNCIAKNKVNNEVEKEIEFVVNLECYVYYIIMFYYC